MGRLGAYYETLFESLIDEVIVGPKSQQNIAILKENINYY